MDETRITAFADPDGYVEIHVRPERESQQIHRLIVSADDDPLEQVVEILASATASEDFLEIPEPQRKREAPPGQSPEEPAQPGSQSDSWLRQQMTGGIRVKPEVKAHPYFRRLKPYTVQPTPTTSLNWSGFELYGPSRSYDYVYGSWVVDPGHEAAPVNTRSSLLSWVGIDGFDTTDLVQAGTGMEISSAGGVAISSLFAWTEFLPQQPTLQIVTSISIRPGDAVAFLVLLTGDYIFPIPNIDGNMVDFGLWNNTTGKNTLVSMNRGTTVIGGSEAEWITERESYNGVYTDLIDYGSADMSNCFAHRVGAPMDQHTYYQDDANRQISMVNGNTTLSTVTPVSSDQMRFTWYAFQ